MNTTTAIPVRIRRPVIRLAALALLVTAGFAAFASTAGAQTENEESSTNKVSNINQLVNEPEGCDPTIINDCTKEGGRWVLGSDVTQAFTTGPSSSPYGFQLTDLDIRFRVVDNQGNPIETPNSDQYVIRIHEATQHPTDGSAYIPGKLLDMGELSHSSDTGSIAKWTSEGVLLKPNTTYVVYIDTFVTAQFSGFQGTKSPDQDDGSADGWSIANGAVARYPSDKSWSTTYLSSSAAMIAIYAKKDTEIYAPDGTPIRHFSRDRDSLYTAYEAECRRVGTGNYGTVSGCVSGKMHVRRTHCADDRPEEQGGWRAKNPHLLATYCPEDRNW